MQTVHRLLIIICCINKIISIPVSISCFNIHYDLKFPVIHTLIHTKIQHQHMFQAWFTVNIKPAFFSLFIVCHLDLVVKAPLPFLAVSYQHLQAHQTFYDESSSNLETLSHRHSMCKSYEPHLHPWILIIILCQILRKTKCWLNEWWS